MVAMFPCIFEWSSCFFLCAPIRLPSSASRHPPRPGPSHTNLLKHNSITHNSPTHTHIHTQTTYSHTTDGQTTYSHTALSHTTPSHCSTVRLSHTHTHAQTHIQLSWTLFLRSGCGSRGTSDASVAVGSLSAFSTSWTTLINQSARKAWENGLTGTSLISALPASPPTHKLQKSLCVTPAPGPCETQTRTEEVTPSPTGDHIWGMPLMHGNVECILARDSTP